jgi:hypothetical protein
MPAVERKMPTGFQKTWLDKEEDIVESMKLLKPSERTTVGVF